MQDILFLKPIFQERIWGGTRLRDVFGYNIPNDLTGECWAISAHRNGDCTVTNGPLAGKTLSAVYASNRDLFANIDHPSFPLLTKILDASDDLSVQVHPDDAYGLRVENDLGKTECWYVIDCDEGAEIIYGHHAKTKEEMEMMINNHQWDDFLRRVKIKPGDFFYVPSGTLHALGKGTLILETQQSSDTTYRVYDYDRRDQQGNLRELHIEKAKEVLNVPHQDSAVNISIEKIGHTDVIHYIESEFFTVKKLVIKDTYQEENKTFQLVSVLSGNGYVNGEAIKQGDHFIVTAKCLEIQYEGNLELIVSHL